MTKYQVFKVPICSSILLVGILGSYLAPVRAASLNLTNSSINCEESPTGDPSKQKGDIDKFLPKPNAQPSVGAGESNAPGGGENSAPEEPNILAANADTSETDTAPIAQLPPNAISQGEACELVDGQVCGVGGEVCDIAGPIPEGGLEQVAGLPWWPLLGLAGLPFIGSGGGGGGDDNPPNPPPTQEIPEPSTIFGSAVALGLVWGMNKKSKNRSRKQRSKDKTQKD